MAENNNQKKQNPFSAEAWQEHNTLTVMFTEDLGFKVRHIDIASWLADQKGNPLMATLQKSMKEGGKPLDVIGENENAIEGISSIIDQLLIAVVIEPPLVEQGHEDGLSLKNVMISYKMEVFQQLTGGQQYAQMNQFRGGQAGNVVAAPEINIVS